MGLKAHEPTDDGRADTPAPKHARAREPRRKGSKGSRRKDADDVRVNLTLSVRAYQLLVVHAAMEQTGRGAYVSALIEAQCTEWQLRKMARGEDAPGNPSSRQSGSIG